MAYFVSRWNRGVLPVAAALAVLFAVIAAVAGPAWFERDDTGFEESTLDASLLGLLTLLLVPVQLLLVAVGMRGFQQQWNVEVEVTREEADRYRGGGVSGGQLHPAQPWWTRASRGESPIRASEAPAPRAPARGLRRRRR